MSKPPFRSDYFLNQQAFASLLDSTPQDIFAQWFADAKSAQIAYPNAMTLATVDEWHRPQARTVLLKQFDETGFVFFTNRESRKGRALLANENAALLFYWQSLSRQVKIEGATSELPRAQVEEYFASRPRYSQISAWASRQSQPIDTLQALDDKIIRAEKTYAAVDVPPPYWSGFILTPRRIEFWQEGDYRRHWRLAFERESSAHQWRGVFLQP